MYAIPWQNLLWSRPAHDRVDQWTDVVAFVEHLEHTETFAWDAHAQGWQGCDKSAYLHLQGSNKGPTAIPTASTWIKGILFAHKLTFCCQSVTGWCRLVRQHHRNQPTDVLQEVKAEQFSKHGALGESCKGKGRFLAHYHGFFNTGHWRDVVLAANQSCHAHCVEYPCLTAKMVLWAWSTCLFASLSSFHVLEPPSIMPNRLRQRNWDAPNALLCKHLLHFVGVLAH